MGILLVFIIMVAVSVAGCASSPTPGATASPVASTGTATPAASTGTPSVTAAPTTSSSDAVKLFDMGSFNWFEYKMSSGGMDSTMKFTMDTASYGGVSNARHLTDLMVVGTGGQSVVTTADLYYDLSNGDKLLGGHAKATMGGQTIFDKDIPANDPSYAQSDFAGSASGATPVYVGIESVTVPKGTYPTAKKYTATNNGSVTAYWLAPGIPVPVQITSALSDGSGSSTMQLVDFG